ncbi:MAG: response regulator [Lachnospiraceae bacterium]|nr:response regulator [Lachnospiraceae bacterium]
MKKRAVVISTTETFTVRGLEMKLGSIGMDVAYAAAKLSEVEPLCDVSDLIVIYTDDNLIRCTDTLVYIKDHCIAKGKQVMVIGALSEFESIDKFIPESVVYKFYERPLDMEKFLDEVEKYLSESAEQERKKSILIVDDDVSYMTMIMNWLKDSYRVSLANSGMQAITWLAKNKADLILLDYEMPVTSGPQVLEMIKSDTSMAKIPVFFLTGKSDKESIMKVLDLKPAGYLLKSIDRKGLRETLSKYFATQMTKKK